MAKLNSRKTALAMAAAVVALAVSAPVAQASEITYDWTFQTTGTSSGSYVSGNVLLSIDSSSLVTSTAAGATFPNRYNIDSASGGVSFFGPGGTLVQSSSVTGLMDPITSAADDWIYSTGALGTSGISFAFDGFSFPGIPGLAGGVGLTLSPGPDVQVNDFFDVFYIAQGRDTSDDITLAALPGAGNTSQGTPVVEEQIGSQLFTQVPEPFTIGILGMGLVGLGAAVRRRQQV